MKISKFYPSDLLKLTLWIFYAVLPIHMWSQVHSTVVLSKDTVEMGDPVTVGIRISIAEDVNPEYISFESWASLENRLYPTDSASLEPIADLEILKGGSWSVKDVSQIIPFNAQNFSLSNGQWIAEVNLEIAVYNAGQFILPGPGIISDSILLKGTSESASLTVLWPGTLSTSDSLALEPIKDIFNEPAHWSDYTSYLLLVVAAGILFYLWYRFRKKRPLSENSEFTVPENRRPAHEIALEALKSLDAKRLWQVGQIKQYQSELTAIIRQYLFDRYNIPAQKMTTDDIILATYQVNMTDNHKNTLRQILNVADLVKFARAFPDQNIHTEFMEKAILFVKDTCSVTDIPGEKNPE